MAAFMLLTILLTLLPFGALGGCSFVVNESKYPNPPEDPTPFQIDADHVCADYRNQSGCCNSMASLVQTSSYGKIDTIFGNSNGGCDICGVNLKRFWCEYACSPRQDQFVTVGDYVTIPNPEKPGQEVTVESVTLYVHSDTACQLFGSCQRTSYAAQVSAMQTPAGFLTFQGSNAIDDGFQTITIKFTDDRSKGLYLQLDECDREVYEDSFHGFNVTGNCTCNSCKKRCPAGQGYEPTGVMQGFDGWLVLAVWSGVVVVTALLTTYRWYRERQDKKEKKGLVGRAV